MNDAKARLAGQTALVTGASRGIGRAIAERLARDGARVIGTATSAAGAEAIAQALQPLGGEGRVLDVRDAAACEALLGEIGALSILINNAGVTRDTLLLRMKDEDWAEVIDTDLTSIFRLSRAVLRGMMKARYGRIVSIGSVVGSMGNPGQANYCAAKAGLIGFSKALAQEIGSRGITVNVVAPGFIETDMTRALSEDQRNALLGRVPVQRLGAPDDIAAAVAFLASREAGYITGETLHVNGGLHMV
jgi:3-oxoacyl-[acyl-carrier protein] reductase